MSLNVSLQCGHCGRPIESEPVECHYQYAGMVYCHKCWLMSGAAEQSAYEQLNEHIRRAEINQQVYAEDEPEND